jgi:uncharacterized protein
MLAWILVIVGGINWGLIGFFNYDLVGELLGPGSSAATVVYDLVGLSAVYMLYTHWRKN